MIVEIISIGDELLIGQTLNTNASWLGKQLLEIGAIAKRVTTIGDDQECIKNAWQAAADRANVIITTGGLGPTHDDVTIKAACDFFASDLIINHEVLENIKTRFQKRGIPLSKINKDQALVPAKAEIILNEQGTAPCLKFVKEERLFYILPGVPHEMMGIMISSVLPELKKELKDSFLEKKTFSTTGIAESILAERLDLRLLETIAEVAFLPNPHGVKLRIICQADNREKARENLEKATRHIRERAARFIYAEEDISLENVLAKWFVENNKTIAVAESCTGGLIAHRFTNIPGSSKFFERGVVTYSNESKMDILNVPAEYIEEFGAVSAKVAEAMAEGIRKTAGTDFGISATGIAGPDGGTENKPVGLFFTGFSSENETVSERFVFADQRIINKERFSQAALDLLWRKIYNIHD